MIKSEVGIISPIFCRSQTEGLARIVMECSEH